MVFTDVHQASVDRFKLILIGAGNFAQLAFDYFSEDARCDIVAFCVENEFRKADCIGSVPIVDLNQIEYRFSPTDHYFFVAVTSTHLNKVRERLFNACIQKKFKPASFVSKTSSVSNRAKLGPGIFIYENVSIQAKASIGTGCIIGANSHIGHDSKVGDFSYIAANSTLGGYADVGQRCLIGLGSVISDCQSVQADTFLSAGSVVHRSLDEAGLYRGDPAKKSSVSVEEYFKYNSKYPLLQESYDQPD